MNWTDDELMAYADGELGADRRAAIDDELTTDAVLQSRVASLKAQRERVAAAYAGVLAEPVPDRLRALIETKPAAAVVDLAAQRSRRMALPSWAQWGGMAASVVVGVLLGTHVGRQADADQPILVQGGQAVAAGPVAKALDDQLSSDPVGAAGVAVPLSFVGKDGNYCRAFTIAKIAGLACNERGIWTVQQLASAERTNDGAMRQASTALPSALLEAAEQRMVGQTLSATQEREAQGRSWRR